MDPETQLRSHCLSEAIRAHSSIGADADSIVAMARQFLAFTKGEKVRSREEASKA